MRRDTRVPWKFLIRAPESTGSRQCLYSHRPSLDHIGPTHVFLCCCDKKKNEAPTHRRNHDNRGSRAMVEYRFPRALLCLLRRGEFGIRSVSVFPSLGDMNARVESSFLPGW